MGNKTVFFGIIGTLALAGIIATGFYVGFDIGFERGVGEDRKKITSFRECVETGSAVVMESYPRRCRTDDGNVFTEDIGNELEKIDLIRLSTPRPNMTVENPLFIQGEARGTWYFEATFPVVVVDWDGKIIGQGYMTATDDWMTESFVPFEGEISFNTEEILGNYSNKGTLILKKANASGLPEHDDALEIPVFFNLK